MSGAELTVGLERLEELFPEVAELAKEHFHEVQGNEIDSKRPWNLDFELMIKMEALGALKIIAARLGERLVGYYTWNLEPDIESKGLMIAQQGAWFVKPGLESKAVGAALFAKSVEIMRGFGAKALFPHHRLEGRGKNLGKFFKRMGATEIQHTYYLWIGD